MNFLPKLISDQVLYNLSKLLHEELDGYFCPLNDKYYCHSCTSFENNPLERVTYHNVSHFPPPYPDAFRCYICYRPIALQTPLVDCRKCFLYYLQTEQIYEFNFNRNC